MRKLVRKQVGGCVGKKKKWKSRQDSEIKGKKKDMN